MSDLTVNEEKSLSEETSGATDHPGPSTLAISGEVVEDEVGCATYHRRRQRRAAAGSLAKRIASK